MTDTTNQFLPIDREIIADAFTSNETRDVLYALCDTIGSRFSGTEGERLGAEHIAGKFEEYELDSVEIEEFPLKAAWRRGAAAELRIVTAGNRIVPCLALPYGASSPPGGVSGELIDIGPGAAEDVERLADQIRGRIVFTDASGAHRSEIFGRVVEAGATAFIMRSRAPGMMLPTGCVSFGFPGKIPAIGIAHASGLQIQRLANNGKLEVTVTTHDSFEPGTSRNVVGEIRGKRFPEELVVIGGHMDSHDVAPGAVDNASGTVCVVEVARLLARRKDNLERTIRFVTFGSEEVGLLGSYRHVDAHLDDMPRIRLMLNLDCMAMSRPKGFVFHKLPAAEKYVEALRRQMNEPLSFVDRIHPHSDHFPFVLKGVPTAEITGGEFNPGVASFGHMAGDTADKVSLIDLREGSALAARLLLRASNDPNWPFKTRTEEEVTTLLEESGIAKALEYEKQHAAG